jgi:hypothetical protein
MWPKSAEEIRRVAQLLDKNSQAVQLRRIKRPNILAEFSSLAMTILDHLRCKLCGQCCQGVGYLLSFVRAPFAGIKFDLLCQTPCDPTPNKNRAMT